MPTFKGSQGECLDLGSVAAVAHHAGGEFRLHLREGPLSSLSWVTLDPPVGSGKRGWVSEQRPFISFFFFFFKDYIYFFFLREGKGGRKRGKHQCVAAPHVPPTGDRT